MESIRAAARCYPPPCAGQSHVEILDSNRACESAAGFQSCANDPISIPMLRPFAENWPHAIALPCGGGLGRGVVRTATQARQTTTPTPNPSPQGGGERTECSRAMNGAALIAEFLKREGT